MTAYITVNNRKRCLCFCAILTGLLVSLSAQAYVDRPGSVQASGEGAIFDVKATAAGTLRICTKPGRVGDLWRATIGQVTTAGGVSAIGTGSTASFTGCVSRLVAANIQYLVLVTWERPLPGTFPSAVTVRFTGPTDATNPPVIGVNGAALTALRPRPISFVELAQGCPADGATITCGALITGCSFNSTSDLDLFRFSAPVRGAASIKICGPADSRWQLYDPTGNFIGEHYNAVVQLPLTGLYTLQTYNIGQNLGIYSLSLEGVSQAYQCGLPIAFSQTKSGTLDACADTDTFQFVCQTNQVVSINVVGPGLTGWQLYDPTGNFIGGILFGVATAKCTTSGTHTIRVDSSNGATGAYSLSLSKISGP